MKDKGIFIKNIYYMLAYAFRVLRQNSYEKVAAEEFETVFDLFAEILCRGISRQLKQGLYRTYVSREENLPAVRGKLLISGTIRNQVQRDRKACCEYEELSANNLFNQILKAALRELTGSDQVKRERRAELKKLLPFFDGVDEIRVSNVRWESIRRKRGNANYEMLLNLCYFVFRGMIQTEEAGRYRVMTFSDESMSRLYEKFILEYMRHHHPYLEEIRSAQVKWNLTEEPQARMIRFLPVMQTDIFLRLGDEILIIDAKYYGHTMQSHYEKETIHSGNLYQIFTYVKNQDDEGSGNVSGMLLYAKTEEEITPDCSFVMGGNRIRVETLDLNQEFSAIAGQLDEIIESSFDAHELQRARER